ncbi:MAG TPA: AsmA family protein [Chromatiales bacterium]|nr:AsmA family protein [Thiotrichales bacterium]HIP69154.1 AsmA family protein [Chromatiales bacterium]
MKVIKWILWVLLILIVLVVAGVGIAIATLDPNDYKPQIAEQVQKQTGRKLEIVGEIKWSLFPWLGLSLGETQFGNAPGFGDQPFAKFKAIDAHVELLPLLKKQVSIRTVTLKGLEVNLARNAKGEDNWSDLTKPAEEKPQKEGESTKSMPNFVLAVEGLEVIDASLVFDDQQAGTKIRITPLNVKAGQLIFGQPMPAKIDFTLYQDQLTMMMVLDGQVTVDPENDIYHIESTLGANVDVKQDKQTIKVLAKGNIIADPMQGGYQLDGLTVDTLVTGEGYPSDGVKLVTQTNIKANLNEQTISASPIRLELADLVLEGLLNVEQFIDAPKYTGKLVSKQFNPRKLMQALGMTPPETRQTDALQSAKLDFTISGNKNSIQLKPLSAKLDQSTLSGQFSIKDFSTQAIRYDLTIDQLNADHYLPPKEAGAVATAEGVKSSPASDAVSLPAEMLRKLNLAGTARINQFTFNKLNFSNASLTTEAKNGLIKIKPLSAKAYQGSAKINAELDVRKKTPVYRSQIDLKGVRSEKILQTLFGDPYISGAADFDANITTAGATISALKKGLNGKFNARFRDGSIKGSKLAKKLTEAKNGLRKLRGKPPLQKEVSGETRFSLMQASGTITNGIVKNQDLRVEAPIAFIKGEGTANLPASTVDYTLYLAEKEKEKKQRFLPIEVSGPFANLHYKIKLDALAKERLEEEKEKAKEKLKAKLEEKTEKQKEKIKEKLGDELGDKLGDKLKDLFK